MIILNDNQTSIINKILGELNLKKLNEINYNDDNNELEFIEINIHQILNENEKYIINFYDFYELLPFFKIFEQMYDLELPSEFPLGSLDEEKIKIALNLKSLFYCYILSLFIPEFLWEDQKSFILKIPKKYLTN